MNIRLETDGLKNLTRWSGGALGGNPNARAVLPGFS
jgi:hypothetical protein